MEKKTELIPFEDLLTEFYGEIGTPLRGEHEKKVAEAVRAYRNREAAKVVVRARKLPCLCQKIK